MADISKTRWTQLVRQGRQALQQESDAKWMLGDLAQEAAPVGENGVNNGSGDRLQEYAAEVGIEVETLRQYRRVAELWPAGRRLPAVSWSVHQITTPDDVDLLKRLKAEHPKGRVTVDAVRLARGRKPTRYPPPTDLTEDEEVAVATRVLSQPTLARRVMANPVARERTRQAAQDHARETAAPPAQPVGTDNGMARYSQASRLLSDAHRLVTQALGLVMAGPLEDDFKADLLTDLDKIDTASQGFREYVSTGRADFDEAVEALLRGGA